MYGNAYGSLLWPVLTRSIKAQEIPKDQIDNFEKI